MEIVRKCRLCKAVGHYRPTCPNNPKRNLPRPPYKCGQCGEEGHFRSGCHNKPIVVPVVPVVPDVVPDVVPVMPENTPEISASLRAMFPEASFLVVYIYREKPVDNKV